METIEAGSPDRQVPDPFRAIADPTRRRIIDLVGPSPRPVGELSEILGISQPAVSQQLKQLRETGVVTHRQVGRERHYELVPGALAAVRDWLDHYDAFWDDRLDRLGAHLDKQRN